MLRPTARILALSVLLVLGVLGAGAVAQAAPEADPVPAAPLKVLPMGASITYGTGSSTGNGYRAELKKKLGAAGVTIDYVGSQKSGTTDDPENEGHPGWRIDQVAAQAPGWLTAAAPDVVLLNVGFNDVNQDHELATAPQRLGALLDAILAQRPTAQVLASTLAPSADPANNAQINEFNTALRTLVNQKIAAGAAHLHLAELNTALTVGDLTSDGIHPNDAGFVKMGDAWFQALQPVLAGSGSEAGFFSDLEAGSPQPTWVNAADGSQNVKGYCCALASMESGVRSEIAYNGSASALMYSGTDAAEDVSFSYNKVFDVSLLVTDQTELSYRIFPQDQNGTHVAVDLALADGRSLRDSGAVDQNGTSIHPDGQGAGGHLVVNQWNEVKVSLAKLTGATIEDIRIGYDQPGGTGPFRGYIDEVRITG
jgi:lysophospholipase L1-like esterase